MDIKLFYREKGEGKALILLHGNDEDSTYFNSQIDFFSSYYKVIAIDTRGHGNSPRGNAPFTIEQFAEDLKDFMDEFNICNAIILGFSDGANIAMKFALKYPNKVHALILNGGNLNPKGIKFFTQLSIEIGYKIAKIFAKKSPDAKGNAEMLGLMVNDPFISANELSSITAPTLVIAGTKDVIKESHTKKIAQNIPNARLSIIPGNHYIAAKNHEIFNQKVWEFLNLI